MRTFASDAIAREEGEPNLVRRGFTLIEIALCLAIIGFGLVAIIGVLPAGLNVQRENRDQTVITHDAAVWIDAIRSGARGFDDLTNYVVAITNTVQLYELTDTNWLQKGSPDIYAYTRNSSTLNTVNLNPPLYLTNGARIVGLLSKPRIENRSSTEYYSNYVVAIVRAMSGTASEKMPQTNTLLLSSAFTYRMIAEIVPYVPFDPESTNTAGTTNDVEIAIRRDRFRVIETLRADSHDVRLLFRWPVLPNNVVGSGRQTFRTLVGGRPTRTNDAGHNLYFFQPPVYGQLQ